ncbi:MAG: AIPR family protein [Oscillospiraceae bacterium]|nr:AIPR family protein [Oscillospiraceae bacterium]
MAKLKFKVEALRTLVSPYRKEEKDERTFETIYYLLVDMRDLPANIPLDVNPREPKMSTNVAHRLLEAVVEPETDFYINNRGIVISARSLNFDSTNSEVTIDIGDQDNEEDKYLYGILDGGHTYTAIMTKRSEIPADLRKFVRIEVITNVQNITQLSDARNTSVQVSDIALFNLDDKFEDIKNVISDQVYADQIAYKDNEDKPIHVSELLRLVYAFDIDKYPDDTVAPVQSYSGKAQVFKRYKQAYNTPFYRALIQQLPILVELYDVIERELPEKYKEYKKAQGVAIPRFGSVKGIEAFDNPKKTEFLSTPTHYSISSGYIYPIFGAFRSLLRFNAVEETISWLFNPVEIWNEVGTTIVQNTFESSTNPQLAGKDKQLWLSNYRIVETQSLRKLLGNR